MLTPDKQKKAISSFKKMLPPSKPRYLIENNKNINKLYPFGQRLKKKASESENKSQNNNEK